MLIHYVPIVKIWQINLKGSCILSKITLSHLKIKRHFANKLKNLRTQKSNDQKCQVSTNNNWIKFTFRKQKSSTFGIDAQIMYVVCIFEDLKQYRDLFGI